MAHAKINLSRMYDWIERNLDLDVPQPSDADIMSLFGFNSAEQARTLLAELADAGRITIKGYGETRTIALGRIKSALLPAPRPTPSAKRSDPVVDAGVAKIAAIVARGGNAGSAHAVQAGGALKRALAKPRTATARPIKLPAASPVSSSSLKEPATMPAKTVRPSSPASAPVTPQSADPVLSLDGLLQLIRQRFDDRPDHSVELAKAIERAEVAERRAETSERKLEALRAALA
jgi:hypothetical protein